MDLYSEGKHPNIHEIYDRLQQILDISDATKKLWKELELKTEEENLLPRRRMCEALDFAVSTGKEIYFVSDMYLPTTILRELLGRLGIEAESRRILVSCDYGMSKCTGLFNLLKNKIVGKKILHVGDSFEADDQSARESGIDDTFRIKSALNMLEDSYACELLKYEATLYNRLLIGEFISTQLNDPFIFSITQGKFLVENNYDMAYSFLAPVICNFFSWMIAKAKELKLEYILFSARDGYLMEEISKLLRGSIPDFPETQYFYTSRAVSVLAGLESDNDILYAAHLAFAGSIEEMLKCRFLLTVDEIQARVESSDDDYVLKHKEAIMKHSKDMRKNYLRYLERLPVGNKTRVGFFDFVSSGTCQKGVSSFVDFDLYGLYFVQLYDEYKKDLKIESMYGVKCAYKESYHLLEDYFFMENVLTSFEPTLQSFDRAGRPAFLPEKRTEGQLEALKDIHNGILDYVQYTKMGIVKFKDIDKALPDLIFHLLRGDYSVVATDYFTTEVLEDEFCNRKFILAEDK
jgi:predicted HAD superfamily hydrolase